jgi:thiosulfate/3-mercaptopyruvate sulfurtransferase
LRGVFEQAGVTKDKALITYCTIGNRASEAWFALKYLLDYPDVRVYYGSWVEWGKGWRHISRVKLAGRSVRWCGC